MKKKKKKKKVKDMIKRDLWHTMKRFPVGTSPELPWTFHVGGKGQVIERGGQPNRGRRWFGSSGSTGGPSGTVKPGNADISDARRDCETIGVCRPWSSSAMRWTRAARPRGASNSAGGLINFSLSLAIAASTSALYISRMNQ